MKHRILFIDDDYITIECAVLHLQLTGHDVDVCEDIEKAFAKLKYEDFSFVFVDVMLAPGNQFDLGETLEGRYTGLRLVERVFTDDNYCRARECKWVFVTNWREEPEVDAIAAEYGMRVLRKPISIAQIEEVIEE